MKFNNEVEILFDEGINSFNIDEYDEAITIFTKVLMMDPDHPDAQYYMALSWANKGNYNKALAEFTKAIKKNPHDTDSLIGRGEAWRNKGVIKKALLDFKKALTMDPDNPDYKKLVFDLEEK